MNSNNRLKGLSSIALSDIIGTSATAFFWFFLASLITPEEYGEIFFYLGIVSIISSVVLLANQFMRLIVIQLLQTYLKLQKIILAQ